MTLILTFASLSDGLESLLSIILDGLVKVPEPDIGDFLSPD